jgi:hypothetical protein
MGEGTETTGESPPSSETLAIARRLSRTDARVIGLLPASKSPVDVSRLATALAGALRHFTQGPIAVVASWPSWNGRAGGAVEPDADASRPVRLEPPPCSNPALATVALEVTLANRRSQFPRLLVDLTGYAAAGELPAVVGAIDGVAFLAQTRATLKRRLQRLAESLPPGRNLGTILVD